MRIDDLDELERLGEATTLTMESVGPVADAYVRDRRFFTNIMGPYGSAKTTSNFQKILNIALWQRPDRNGVRHARGCIVRPTYGQLADTVMKDWFSWFPRTRDNWNGDLLEHKITLEIPEVATLRLEILFRAVDDRDKAEKVFKGMGLTFLWPNEIDTCHPAVLEFGVPRLGRYPTANMGGCAWYGVISDMNAPDIDNYTVDLFVNQDLKLPPEMIEAMREELGADFGVGFHRQPGGLDPNAENLKNLPKGYYQRLMVGKSENYIRRFVHNQFGAVRNGQPVYPEYNDAIHCAAEPMQTGTLPVALAIDAGSTPAVVFGQADELGRMRVLEELVVFAPDAESALEQMGADSFGHLAGAFWKGRFARNAFGGAWGDPAAWYAGGDDEFSWVKRFWAAFRKEVGASARTWKIKPAPVAANRLEPRLEAVRKGLVSNPGGKPGLQISPTCRHLRRGFNNGYVIVRTQLSNGMGRWQDKPLKNDFSHVHDALQYLALGLSKRGVLADGGEPVGRSEPRERALRRHGRVDYGSGIAAHRELA